jgi:deoxyribodipyrimidine photolyase-related protein
LNSLEGFVRQVIGWREFIFWIGRERLADYESEPNFFGHRRKLKACWYDGTTGLLPLDTVIRRTEKHAYCHHIERLMVLGSAMLMCEVDPQESYRWFMEMFIDSADWVMAPNVLGMSQFADGGVFATKPYLSGSAYILKMSDYPKDEWCDVWDGLYWRFIDRNLSFFSSNHRMSMMVGGLGRLEPARRERIFGAAERFIERVTDPAE